jgi:hypothetical protein
MLRVCYCRSCRKEFHFRYEVGSSVGEVLYIEWIRCDVATKWPPRLPNTNEKFILGHCLSSSVADDTGRPQATDH